MADTALLDTPRQLGFDPELVNPYLVDPNFAPRITRLIKEARQKKVTLPRCMDELPDELLDIIERNLGLIT